MSAPFITATGFQASPDVRRSKSYQIIQNLNRKLKFIDYHTIIDKYPFFNHKFYSQEIGGKRTL